MARKFDINFARWPAKQVLTHLSGAIREFGVRVKDLEESDPYYGLQWEDYADVHDALVGLAFVTCQIYIADTITEAMRSFPALGSQLARKSDWCRLNVKTDEIAPVEVMDAAANYFKHRDEWGLGHKNANRQGRQTLGILERALGQPVRERGCALVAAEFIGDVEVADVEKWLKSIDDWREAIRRTALGQ